MNLFIIRFKRKVCCPQYFSLIEVLVALTIISVCFVVMFHSLSNDINNTAVINGYTTAAMLSKKKMAETILDEKKLEAGKAEGNFGDKYPGYKWNLEIKKEEKDLYHIRFTTEFAAHGTTRDIIDSTHIYKTEKSDSDDDKTKPANIADKKSPDLLTEIENSSF